MNFGKILTRVFGSRNDRLVKRYRKIAEQINALDGQVGQMTDEQLRARAHELRAGLVAGKLQSADVMPEGLAIMRETMDRAIGIRQIFNPDGNFNPDDYKRDVFPDSAYELYDDIQRNMIATGEAWQKVKIPVALYDAIKKLYPESRPPYRARCFDVQVIGGLVLYEGRIAEMATGEGKTFVAPLACFLRVLEGNHCHVVTVNDYLVKRDSNWVKPAFEALGFTVGYIQQDMDPGGDTRRKAYQCDVTYGTNSEFGFDYLRDNMRARVSEQVQGPLQYVIVDEIDSILIDEARTPLIISGAARDDAAKYKEADRVARKIIELHEPYARVKGEVDQAKRDIKSAEGDEDKHRKDKTMVEAARQRKKEAEERLAAAEESLKGHTAYYETELDRKSAHLTHEGIAAAQEVAGVGSFYVGGNMEWPHLMDQSLRAYACYERDKDYVVERNPRTGDMEVVIVDEFTGRKMVGRQWSDGLHQAVEAKERVTIKQETQTLATITLQNFFKLYKSLSGMTGTAQTEAEEFAKIYKLEVVTIPTNRPRVRLDAEDRVYRTEREKWNSILEEIKLMSDAGRPVLVGTTSVEKSEMLSQMLKRRYGIEHEVLNAKQHEREAHIVERAGERHVNAHNETVGNVTIATNMAGRGTDIKPAPETFMDVVKADSLGKGQHKYTLKRRKTEETIEVGPDSALVQVLQLSPTAKVVGGLHVIATERHTARRIDNQLRGRAGRQGDAGSSRFYVSLQDDLMKLFYSDWAVKVLGRVGMEEGEAIEAGMVSRGIERAQKKVEERNYLARKNLLEYDEVMDKQRSTFYGMRQKVLEGRDIDEVVWDIIGDSIGDAVDKYIVQDYVAACASEWGRVNFELSVDPIDLRGMRDMPSLEAFFKGQARTEVETNLASTLQEFMGEDVSDDASTWDTRGLINWARTKYGVELTVATLKQMTAQQVEETIREAALTVIEERDCTGVQPLIEPRFSESELSRWAKEKFDVEVNPDELVDNTGRQERSKDPVELISLIEKRVREAYTRREVEYPVDHVLSYVLGAGPQMVGGMPDNTYLFEALRGWIVGKFGKEISLEELQSTPLSEIRQRLLGFQEEVLGEAWLSKQAEGILAGGETPDVVTAAFNKQFRTAFPVRAFTPVAGENESQLTVRQLVMKRIRGLMRAELTELEQYVMIQILDQSWKDHLYAMDMLRAGIGLQAFAEKDPRIVYKKEGYRFFQEMMIGVRDKVTDLIFRASFGQQMEQPKSNYKVTGTVKQEATSYGVGEELAAEKAGGDQQMVASGGGAEEAPVATKPITREGEKVGRNDPCPCGSGQKYKKCCGKDE
jgi:preprotein translocase subunit SecA